MAKSNKITRELRQLEGNIRKLQRTLSKQWDLEVVIGGTRCDYDGQKMRLPHVGDAPLTDDTRKKLIEEAEHESGHGEQEMLAIDREKKGQPKMSPLDIMKSLDEKKKKVLLNAFEDIRSESERSKRLPGSGIILRRGNVRSCEAFRKKKAAGEAVSGSVFHEVACGIIMQSMSLPTDWVSDLAAEVLGRVQEEIEASHSIVNAEQSKDLALKVFEKLDDLKDELEEEQKKREQKKQEQKKQEQQDDEDGDGEGGEGDQDQAEADEDEDGDEGQAGKGDQDEDEDGDQDADGSTGDGDQDADEDGDEDEDGNEDKDGDKDSDNEPGDTDKDQGQNHQDKSDDDIDDALDALDEDTDTDDTREFLKDELESELEDVIEEHTPYLAHPEALAKDTWVNGDEADIEDYQKLKEKVQQQVSALRAKLLNLLRARTQSSTIRGQRRGKLDVHRLYTVATSKSRSVFCKEDEGEDIDTAIEILVDESGSMGHGSDPRHPAYYSRLATIALSETLDRLNIPFEVVGFTNDWEGVYDETGMYTRVVPFRFRVYKGWNENFKRTKTRLATISGREQNADGEAVMVVAQRLAARPEARKILFVLSDGEPSAFTDTEVGCQHLKDTVKKVADTGIEVYGIGFGLEEEGAKAVTKFYNKDTGANCIVIPPGQLETLAIQVYKMLRAKLLGGRK